jgi:AraC-like DNA-binding protein
MITEENISPCFAPVPEMMKPPFKVGNSKPRNEARISIGRPSFQKRRLIQKRYAEGVGIEELARDYGMSPKTIKKHCGGAHGPRSLRVESEGRVQSYRDNLAWAMQAAGEYLRTQKRPSICPNDSAFFLYHQAIDDPKDFLSKVAAIEKGVDDSDDREGRASTKRTLNEIKAFLRGLDAPEENNETKAEDQATTGISDSVRQLPDFAG